MRRPMSQLALRARGTVRELRQQRDQWNDAQLRQLKGVLGQLGRGGLDVLHLGDSNTRFVGPGDADRRRLPEMVQAELGPALKVGELTGPGYHPELLAEMVRLLATMDQRPRVIVLGHALRMCAATCIRQHPIYAYRPTIEALRAHPDAGHRLRTRRRGNVVTPADWARFEAEPMTTRWARAETVGGFLEQVRGRRLAGDRLEVQQATFDYLHGEVFSPEGEGARQVATLGAQLRDYAVPVVRYWGPLPVEQGEAYFPGEFADHVQANLAAVTGPFEEALGNLLHPLGSPFETPRDEFIDSRDGTEHWNDRGRARMARRIADAVRAAQS